MKKNVGNSKKILAKTKVKSLISLFVCTGLSLFITSCEDTDDQSVTEEGTVELTPEGPAPEWAPNITDPMLVVIEEFQSYNVPPLHTLSAQEARQQPGPADAVMGVIEDYNLSIPPSTVDTMGIMIPCEGKNIPARIYTPDTGKDSYPVIVYYHGGGWVIAGIDAYSASTEALARKTEAIVVSVGYRQAPEFKFPTAHNDSYAAYEWVLENAGTFNGDSTRVAVVGESAGGNLAAAVSLMAKQRNVRLPLHQVLIYPIADNDFTTPSYQEYQNSLFLNSALMMWFFDYYLNNPEEGDDPRISLVDADLSGMPPTTIIGAEIDPLQSEGKLLAQNLEMAGVATTYELYTGVTHEFFGMAAVLPKAEQAQALAVKELKNAFGTE